jgi:hypothetical protein
MSSLILIKPTLLHILVYIECKVSYAAKILSVVNLPGINTLWAGKIISGKTSLRRLAKILEISL